MQSLRSPPPKRRPFPARTTQALRELHVQFKQSLVYLFSGGPPTAALAGGNCPGGVGAGPPPRAMPPGILPPRACFCGVRSLSLVLADFGTLLFSLFLFLILSSLVFFCSSVV